MRQFILFLSTSSALKLHFPISNFQTIIGKNNQMDVAEDILRIHPDFICIQRVICSEYNSYLSHAKFLLYSNLDGTLISYQYPARTPRPLETLSNLDYSGYISS